MEYVVKNNRLKDYLYTLGFTYREVPDKMQKQEFIYLFSNTESLREAITFYTQFKNLMPKKLSKS